MSTPTSNPSFDDDAVDEFAIALKDKLATARSKGRHGWQTCSPSDLSRMLHEHVKKGDPRDVANFCMFLWSLGARIDPSDETRPVGYEDIEGELERVTARLNAVWSKCRVVFYPPMDDPRGNYPLEHAPRAGKDMRAMIEHRLEELTKPPTKKASDVPAKEPGAYVAPVCAVCEGVFIDHRHGAMGHDWQPKPQSEGDQHG